MGGRLLIVEDEAVLRKHLARRLARAGYDVSTAGSCAEAVAAFAHGSFGILLLDVQLPDGSGLDLLVTLGERAQRCHTVVMTAFATADNEQRAQHLNVRRLLRKPLDLEQVINAVGQGAA